MAVNPGDKISSTVGVDGNNVSIHLENETTGKTFDKTLQMDNPDTSSAEWIAEAPSACDGGTSGNCQPVPLADFSSVDFTKSSATADGQTGSISDFNATAMQLQPGIGGGFGGGQFGDSFGDGSTDSTSTASAVPSTLTSDGAGFTVAWQGDDQQETTTPDDGSGYGQDPGSGQDPGYGQDPFVGGWGSQGTWGSDGSGWAGNSGW